MSGIPYVDLTNLEGKAREDKLRSQIKPAVYVKEDGSTISSEDVQAEKREPLTKPWPVKIKGWEPEVIEKKKPSPGRKGRPSKAQQRKRIFEMYPEWVVLTIEREMGAPAESVPFEEFESTLKTVAMEKGWHLK